MTCIVCNADMLPIAVMASVAEAVVQPCCQLTNMSKLSIFTLMLQMRLDIQLSNSTCPFAVSPTVAFFRAVIVLSSLRGMVCLHNVIKHIAAVFCQFCSRQRIGTQG